MREIKYRAWVIGSKLVGYHGMSDSRFAGIEEQEMMIDVRGVSFRDGKIEFVTDREGDEYSFADGTLIAVRQYTGLKDKSGAEIYEGDILLYTSPIASRSKNRVICEFENGCFLFGGFTTDYVTANGKVIGNIYENPELLEVAE